MFPDKERPIIWQDRTGQDVSINSNIDWDQLKLIFNPAQLNFLIEKSRKLPIPDIQAFHQASMWRGEYAKEKYPIPAWKIYLVLHNMHWKKQQIPIKRIK